MSDNTASQPPYPSQGYAPQQPPKKKHTLRNVILIITGLIVLTFVGCSVLLGAAVNEVDKSIKESENEAGGTNNPITIEEGKAFSVRGFDYDAGWKIKKDEFGTFEIVKLKVANNREDKDSALVEIKFMKGSEVLALVDCTTEPIAVGQKTTLNCLSADELPSDYSKITVNDTF